MNTHSHSLDLYVDELLIKRTKLYCSNCEHSRKLSKFWLRCADTEASNLSCDMLPLLIRDEYLPEGEQMVEVPTNFYCAYHILDKEKIA